MATHSSILTWGNPINKGAWQATVHGVAKSQTQPNKNKLILPSELRLWPTFSEIFLKIQFQLSILFNTSNQCTIKYLYNYLTNCTAQRTVSP